MAPVKKVTRMLAVTCQLPTRWLLL